MRALLSGVDGEGRSRLVEVVDVVPKPVEGGHGVNVARVYTTTESPPPARAPAFGDSVDIRLAPGTLRWMVVDHPAYDAAGPPSTSTSIHHSDALDMVFVHEGNGELLLQDGAHAVTAGDLVVMPGVDHAMRAGPGGLRLVVVSVGTPSPLSDKRGPT